RAGLSDWSRVFASYVGLFSRAAAWRPNYRSVVSSVRYLYRLIEESVLQANDERTGAPRRH
ncbi:MAG: hypothetical protein WEB67_10950, partial [Acidimicrobiia bacterium]